MNVGVVDKRKGWGVSQTCNHGHREGINVLKPGLPRTPSSNN